LACPCSTTHTIHRCAWIVTLPATAFEATASYAHWQHASRLFLEEANVAAVTRQVHLALFMDGKLDLASSGA
jgi:hypothetical protein